jgi:hypothetical protein
MTTLDHYENQLGRAYSWMVGDPQPAPSVQLAAGVLSINRLLADTRNGNMPISRPVADALNLPQSESDNSGMLGRKSWPRRQKWFSDYIQTIMARDLRTPYPPAAGRVCRACLNGLALLRAAGMR